MSDVETAAAFSRNLRTAIDALSRDYKLTDKPQIVYTALAYELAAFIAKSTGSNIADAHFVIADVSRTMREQVNTFAGLPEHP